MTTTLMAEERSAVQVVQILDKNNETISGAKIVLEGTKYVYYTNIKGEVYIPSDILKASKGISVECISYKSKSLKNFELNSKIVLEFR